MQIIPFENITSQSLTEFLHHSYYSWFWHTQSYLDFLKNIHHSRNFKDISFGILDEKGLLLGICPLIIDFSDDSFVYFGLAHEPIPFPGISTKISLKIQQKVISFYFSYIEEISKEHHVDYLYIRIPALAAYPDNGIQKDPNPLILNNLLMKPLHTQVIDLGFSYELLWKSLSKGHRADINSAIKKSVQINIWNHSNITDDIFQFYINMHLEDSAQTERKLESYGLVMEWIKSGSALLCQASLNNEPAAFNVVIIHNHSAYYASACRNCTQDTNSSHLLQWMTIKYLKSMNVKYYDLGLQYFSSQVFTNVTLKDINISRYKRSFGGSTTPVDIGYKFFSLSAQTKFLLSELECLNSSFR